MMLNDKIGRLEGDVN